MAPLTPRSVENEPESSSSETGRVRDGDRHGHRSPADFAVRPDDDDRS